MRSIEICAGAGGQTLGLEQAGFEHVVLVEIDKAACATLRTNRPQWNVLEGDVREFKASDYKNIDLVAGGIPCPPFSVAGKQLGNKDDRDLLPEALRIVSECNPKAVMLENVRGLFDPKFSDYRKKNKRAIRIDGIYMFLGIGAGKSLWCSTAKTEDHTCSTKKTICRILYLAFGYRGSAPYCRAGTISRDGK